MNKHLTLVSLPDTVSSSDLSLSRVLISFWLFLKKEDSKLFQLVHSGDAIGANLMG